MNEYDNRYKAGMYYGKRQAAEDAGYKEAYFAWLETIAKNEALLPRQTILTMPHRTYPQAERAAWVGLTEEELQKILQEVSGQGWKPLLEAIESKLKEKNT